MKILLATDGSDSARSATDYVMDFPFPAHSQITVLTVIDRDVFKKDEVGELNQEKETSLKETEQAVHNEAQELVAGETARLKAAGWSESSEVRVGHPAEEIVRAAERLGSDCIVVGSHGTSGIKRFLLGSVSDHVLEYAPCSVLIVKQPGAQQGAPQGLLLAYDHSGSADKAVEFCASLSLGDRVKVTVMTVLPLITMYRQDIRQRLSWLWQQKEKQAQAALEAVQKKLGRTTEQVDIRLRETAEVSDGILHEAGELGSDLIVLGHKGKGAIEKFLVGSVTTRIAHHAGCSVLAVRGR
jgi:nucleotide-binding universal stress UspA family protein